MEVDRVVADRDPQPAPARPASLAQRLHAPGGLVGMAQRRVVLVREDRVGHRLEQRHETGHAAGQGARRDRQSLVGQPCADALQRTQARIAFEQEARPDADPVGRVGEQPWHGGRRHFHGRRRAVACPAPARAADHSLVGLDLDLDKGGLFGAVGRIGVPAAGTHTRIGRQVMLFDVFFETGPLCAAPAGCAGLPTPRTPGARLLLLLALATELRLRQHRPGRARLRQLGFQLLVAPLQCLHGLVQPGNFPAGSPKEIAQMPHLRAPPQCVLPCSTSFPRLLDDGPQPAPRCLEARLPISRFATRRHLRPAQLLRALPPPPHGRAPPRTATASPPGPHTRPQGSTTAHRAPRPAPRPCQYPRLLSP